MSLEVKTGNQTTLGVSQGGDEWWLRDTGGKHFNVYVNITYPKLKRFIAIMNI